MAVSTLNLTGQPHIKLPEGLKSKEPTFVLRYWLVAEIISQLSDGNLKDKKIIDVGGNGSLLPEILKKKIDILDLPDNDYENYIQASALDMPIKDEAYDTVVSCDVYEHIPVKDRPKFIKELLRVSKDYVVLCGPMYKPESAAAEKRANEFFKDLTGRDHPWLEEHINYTLPKESELQEILRDKGYQYSKFDHGALLPWEMMTKLNLMLIEQSVAQDEAIVSKINDLNSHYTKSLGLKDFAEKGYRTIYVIQKQKTEKPLQILTAKPDPEILNKTILEATNILKEMIIGFRVQRMELDNLRSTTKSQAEHYQALAAELNQIHTSRGWRALQVARRVARPTYALVRKTHLAKPIRLAKRATVKAVVKIPVIKHAVGLTRFELQKQNNQRHRRNEYRQWLQENKPTAIELQAQKTESKHFLKRPLISIIMPTYNTNELFLRDCLESVIAQTYDNWELCIADDASTNTKVIDIIKEYSAKDPRIKYVFRKKNGHISEASNSALKLASGKFVALLDHDDVLWPNALYEVVTLLNQKPDTDFVYTDEDKIDEKGLHHSDPFFKPAWSPEYLRSINYITHFAVIRRELVEKAGRFRKGYEGAQDWDLFLRITRQTDKIEHIPKILYSWRRSEGSTAMRPSAKNYAYENQKKVLLDDAEARGLKVRSLKWGVSQLMWNTEYEIKDQPKVSIIIPTKDKYTYIKKCLVSLKKKTTYKNLEIIIVDTGSTDKHVWRLYDNYKKKFKHMKVVKWNKPFNFALVCNYGATKATGEYLLFLNNDTEVITPNWVELLLQYARQSHVGAVGCKLLYPGGLLQHAGVVLGIGGNDSTPGVAAHLFPAYPDKPVADPVQSLYVGGTRNFSAVTAACIMVSRAKFEKVSGFNGEFQIAWNDVDFCLKLVKAGWYNVYTPQVKLYHHESVSVGVPGSKNRDLDVFNKEIELFGKKWGWDYINNDPYYSPHFRRDIANARLKPVQ